MSPGSSGQKSSLFPLLPLPLPASSKLCPFNSDLAHSTHNPEFMASPEMVHPSLDRREPGSREGRCLPGVLQRWSCQSQKTAMCFLRLPARAFHPEWNVSSGLDCRPQESWILGWLFYSNLSKPLRAPIPFPYSLPWALSYWGVTVGDHVTLGRGVKTRFVRIGVSRNVGVFIDGGQLVMGNKKVANGRRHLETENTISEMKYILDGITASKMLQRCKRVHWKNKRDPQLLNETRRAIHQEDIKILNAHTPKNTASKYVKRKG